MRHTRSWLLGTFLLAAVGGAMFLNTPPIQAQPGPERREERREDRSYWRNHDGRWSHWDSRDKRWYYTDGSHWYTHNGRGWEPYRFDRTFGRDFERGRYAPPAPDATIVVPRHEIYVAPR